MERLADLPDGGVVGLPWDQTGVWWQVVHRKPMPYGYLARYPESVFHRGRRLEELTVRGDYPTLLEATGARYVVRPVGQSGPFVGREAMQLLLRDERFELYVRRSDPLAAGS